MISFVGAGPGAADLITLRGRDRLASADVVVWASSLVPPEVLAHARAGADIHDSASMTLEDVLAVYAAHPEAAVVRLHSGGPSVYGAIQDRSIPPRSRHRPPGGVRGRRRGQGRAPHQRVTRHHQRGRQGRLSRGRRRLQRHGSHSAGRESARRYDR